MPVEGWGRLIAATAVAVTGLVLVAPAGMAADLPAADLPSAPLVGVPTSGSAGLVDLPVDAEAGTTVLVEEKGVLVASGYGTGSASTLTFAASTGKHRYRVRTVDGYGVASAAARVDVAADATPPAAKAVRVRPGAPADSRTTVTLRTETGTRYALLVDGLPLARGSARAGRIELARQLVDGPHEIALVLSDEVGNERVLTRSVLVDVPRLAVEATTTSASNEGIQVIRVTGTPGATARVRVPGAGTEQVRLRGGSGTVRFPLADGTYPAPTIRLTDGAGRIGSTRLKTFTVDTVAPDLRLDDERRTVDGWAATVAAEPGTAVTWRAFDGVGDVIGAGELAASGRRLAVAVDLGDGAHEVIVTATDAAGNESTRRREVAAAPAASGVGDVVAAGGSVLALVVALGLLSLLASAQRGRAAARRQRVREDEAAAAHRDAVAAHRDRLVDHEAAMLLHDQHLASWKERRSQLADLVQRARLDRGMRPPAGFTAVRLRAWEQVYCTVPGSMLEPRSRQGTHHVAVVDDGEVIVTSERVVFHGFKKREWALAQLEGIEHSGADRTMMKVSARKNWSGVTYTDAAHTRLAIALAAADHVGAREAVVGLAEDDLRAHEDVRPVAPPHPGPPPRPPAVDGAAAEPHAHRVGAPELEDAG